ncbi:hypothetical protein NPIL_664521 [Nephila pilipes]|uniref:Uncharacterized protein n=1 Tax=Nephila pilipes TaxID=299642 RepID=A0A8X6UDY6_NEPPI|nr:hypothetical protein NPIL_664521 [Nephila pilipes]
MFVCRQPVSAKIKLTSRYGYGFAKAVLKAGRKRLYMLFTAGQGMANVLLLQKAYGGKYTRQQCKYARNISLSFIFSNACLFRYSCFLPLRQCRMMTFDLWEPWYRAILTEDSGRKKEQVSSDPGDPWDKIEGQALHSESDAQLIYDFFLTFFSLRPHTFSR